MVLCAAQHGLVPWDAWASGSTHVAWVSPVMPPKDVQEVKEWERRRTDRTTAVVALTGWVPSIHFAPALKQTGLGLPRAVFCPDVSSLCGDTKELQLLVINLSRSMEKNGKAVLLFVDAARLNARADRRFVLDKQSPAPDHRTTVQLRVGAFVQIDVAADGAHLARNRQTGRLVNPLAAEDRPDMAWDSADVLGEAQKHAFTLVRTGALSEEKPGAEPLLAAVLGNAELMDMGSVVTVVVLQRR